MSQSDKKCDLAAIGSLFGLPGCFCEGGPYGSGHINDTFVASYDQAGAPVRYIHQRINHRIFKDVPALMQNIHRVTAHLQHRLRQEGAADPRSVLTLVAAPDGAAYVRDAEGAYWRTYVFIEGARTYDIIESPRQAFEAARAFGRFQSMLADLTGPRLHETIADFHNTPRRYDRFMEVLRADTHGRAKDCQPEIDLALGWRAQASRLLDLQAQGAMPERVTHNDTKLNNVMLDDRSGEGICVIDLDTVMPGLSLYDFGDMVRTATNSGAEDERDLSKVTCQLPMFEALAKGYLQTARSFMTPAEVEQLSFAGRLLTLECGVRFLTDYLQGDTYFKIHRPGHNLDRCRTQFKLVSELIRLEPAMNDLVQNILKG